MGRQVRLAVQSLGKALKIWRSQGNMRTSKVIQLLKKSADAKRMLGDSQGAQEAYSEALWICAQLGETESILGVELLVKTGSSMLADGDKIAALQSYTGAWSIICRRKQKGSSVAARIQENIG